jgi:hypothetical protein
MKFNEKYDFWDIFKPEREVKTHKMSKMRKIAKKCTFGRIWAFFGRGSKTVVFWGFLRKSGFFRVFSVFWVLNGVFRLKKKRAKSRENSRATPPESAQNGVFGVFDLKSPFKNLGNFHFRKSQIGLFSEFFWGQENRRKWPFFDVFWGFF